MVAVGYRRSGGPMSYLRRSILHRTVGALVVAGSLGVGGVDAFFAARDWSKMGPLPPGESLPQFRVAMLDGSVFEAADLQGRVSVVTFWATWCPACRSEIADLDELEDELDTAEGGVQFLAVNVEGSSFSPRERSARAGNYARINGLGLPIAVDHGAMARSLRVGPIPHTVVFDRDGVIRYVHQGRVTNASIRG